MMDCLNPIRTLVLIIPFLKKASHNINPINTLKLVVFK